MPAAPFTFNGVSTYVPQTLVRTRVAQSNVGALLPFGKLFMAGAADGGNGQGTIYRGTLQQLQLILRGGYLLDSLTKAVGVGPTSNIVVAVCGTKTAATHVFTVSTVTQATILSGDQGTWTNNITISVIAGTTSGKFAFIVSWPDAFGNTQTVGGLGTAFDNLTTYSTLAAAIAANAILTPPASSGLPPIITINVAVNSTLVLTSATTLAGGTGNGEMSLVFSDFKYGIDAVVNEPYDVGHLANCTDPATQAYLDAQTANVEVYGILRRNVHAQFATGLSQTVSKQVNSSALSAFAVAAAEVLNAKRSILVCQNAYAPNPQTGVYGFTSIAPYYVGRLILDATTGAAGPAEPSTFKPLPGVADIDYAILPGGDLENAIAAGVTVFQRPGDVVPGGVRCVRSVSTAPAAANGQSWPFFEVSALRAADGVLANVKAQVDAAIGSAATVPLLVHLLAETRDVLQLALAAGWITQYDDSSIGIVPGGGSGTGYILTYDAAPTLPFNNAGVDQLVLPFQAQIASSGTVNG